MSLGHYDALIKRTANAFKVRRRVMASAITKHGLEVAGGGKGGSSFWMRAAEGVDTRDLAMRLRDDSVLIESGVPFFAGQSDPSNRYFRLAYSSISEDRIDDGIAKIAAAMNV